MLTVILQRGAKYVLQTVNSRISDALRLDLKKEFYFAYGANMDPDVLRKKGIFPKTSRPAVLQRYHFAISSPCEMAGKGFASIIPSPAAAVFGVIHEVTSLELMILDILEWVPMKFHERVEVLADPFDDNHRVHAWTYIARNRKQHLKASVGYRNLLIDSARKVGLPESYIDNWLCKMPTSDKFEFDHGFRLSNASGRRLFENTLKPLYKRHDELREVLCQKLP